MPLQACFHILAGLDKKVDYLVELSKASLLDLNKVIMYFFN